jgi:hypothetical protein
LGKDAVMLITAAPAMPDIRVKIVSKNGGTYKVKLEIKYLRPCTGNGVGRSPNQHIVFPSNGWHELGEGKEWDIDFGMDAETQRPMIRGGIAYLIAESPSSIRDTLRFFIKGANPTVQQLNTFLNQAPYNGVWFFKKIIFHESNTPDNLAELARQFNPYSTQNEDLSENNWDAWSRMPTFGPPCGWGLGQLDNPSPPAQALWDWQVNVRVAYDLLMGEKHGTIVNHLTACNDIVEDWSNPGRPIVAHADTTEGGITYAHAVSTYFTHAINPHFGDQPTNNRRSFIDACWIKLYNGRGLNHFYYLEPNLEPDIAPEWKTCNWSTWNDANNALHYNYYVRDIGNRNTP